MDPDFDLENDIQWIDGEENLVKLLKDNNVYYRILNFPEPYDIKLYILKDYIIDDPDSPSLESPEDWMESSNAGHLKEEIEDQINKRFNLDFWYSPAPLYHATPDENVESILKNGLNATSETRGIVNNSVGDAVFTSTEPTDIDAYGDNVIEINTKLMKQDGFTPYVFQEPDWVEHEVAEALAHKIGLTNYEHYFDSSYGTSPTTVIVDDGIPAKYLSLYKK